MPRYPHVIVEPSFDSPFGFVVAVVTGYADGGRATITKTHDLRDVVHFIDTRKHLPAYITGAAFDSVLYRMFPPYPNTLYGKSPFKGCLAPSAYIDFDVVRAIIMLQSAGAEPAQIKQYIEEVQAI